MKIKIFETINSDIRNSILQLWRQHAFVHLEKNIQYIFNKNTVFPSLPAKFGSFYKVSKNLHLPPENFESMTSAFAHLWDGFTMKLICYQLKKEILNVSDLAGFAGRIGWSRRWSTNCSNQGHLGFFLWRKCYEIHWFLIFFCFRVFERKKNLMHLRWITQKKSLELEHPICWTKNRRKGLIKSGNSAKTEIWHACFSSSSHLGKNGGVHIVELQNTFSKPTLANQFSSCLAFSLFNGRGLKSKEFSHIGSSAIGNGPFPHKATSLNLIYPMFHCSIVSSESSIHTPHFWTEEITMATGPNDTQRRHG